MDIKAKITELTDKIKKDPKMMENFKKDPVKTVESMIGVDLPDDMLKNVVEGIKAKISLDKVSGGLGALKKLF